MEINVNELLKKEIATEETGNIVPIDSLIDEVMNDFEFQVKSKGKEYYEKGNIKSVAKSNNTFYAKVAGARTYNITIDIDLENEYIDYDCDCPYEFPCKHIFAVLLAIKNKEYDNVELKPFISKKTKTYEEIVRAIPADELKAYILSPEGKDYVCFEEGHFENHFANYLPSQPYSYYYNNLYNRIVLDGYNNSLLGQYMEIAKTLLNNKNYNESFYILKSIIEATNDTKVIDKWQELINLFPLIAMSLRIVYRKCDDGTKEEFNIWKDDLTKNNYYNSIYLEDIILGIK